MKKKVADFVASSVLLGAGTMAVDKMGGSTAGLSAMSGMMPAVGTAMGAGMVMDQMKKLKKVK